MLRVCACEVQQFSLKKQSCNIRQGTALWSTVLCVWKSAIYPDAYGIGLCADQSVCRSKSADGRTRMKIINRIHLLTIVIYCLGVFGSIGILLITSLCFDAPLPMNLIALMILLCPVISAGLRIYAWRRENTILSEEEKNRFGTKVFFMLIPVEISSTLIGTIIVLFGGK